MKWSCCVSSLFYPVFKSLNLKKETFLNQGQQTRIPVVNQWLVSIRLVCRGHFSVRLSESAVRSEAWGMESISLNDRWHGDGVSVRLHRQLLGWVMRCFKHWYTNKHTQIHTVTDTQRHTHNTYTHTMLWRMQTLISWTKWKMSFSEKKEELVVFQKVLKFYLKIRKIYC